MTGTVERCRRCHGSGWVENPVWSRWWSCHEELDGTEPLGEPEEVVCPACEGTGKVLTDEAIKVLSLADEIRRELKSA